MVSVAPAASVGAVMNVPGIEAVEEPGPKRAMPGTAKNFTVMVQKEEGCALGVNLIAAGSVLMVHDDAIDPEGLLGLWNASCIDDLKVARYDRLLQINEYRTTNTHELVDRVKTCEGMIELTFEKPSIRWVKLSGGHSLGLSLKYGPDFAEVIAVQEWFAQKYNAGLSPPQRIKPSSKIVEIDGQRGTGKQLLDLSRKKRHGRLINQTENSVLELAMHFELMYYLQPN